MRHAQCPHKEGMCRQTRSQSMSTDTETMRRHIRAQKPECLQIRTQCVDNSSPLQQPCCLQIQRQSVDKSGHNQCLQTQRQSVDKAACLHIRTQSVDNEQQPRTTTPPIHTKPKAPAKVQTNKKRPAAAEGSARGRERTMVRRHLANTRQSQANTDVNIAQRGI